MMQPCYPTMKEANSINRLGGLNHFTEVKCAMRNRNYATRDSLATCSRSILYRYAKKAPVR